MIAKLTYVMCDDCGNPSEPVMELADEARYVARTVDKFIFVHGRDLCPGCVAKRRERRARVEAERRAASSEERP